MYEGPFVNCITRSSLAIEAIEYNSITTVFNAVLLSVSTVQARK